jgi:hypothetical protein
VTYPVKVVVTGALLLLGGWACTAFADATALSGEASVSSRGSGEARDTQAPRQPGSAGSGLEPNQQTATVLQYEEQEPGTDHYQTRMIVTPRYLRIDDGFDARDFLLFDRQDKTIYSVSAADASVLVIKYSAPAGRVPSSQKHEVVEEGDRAPDVGGTKVRHYRLLTDNRQCYDLYAAEGLLPQAVAAWREYRESLAAEQARTLAWTPKEMRSTCRLANNIHAPTRLLAHGLPVRYAETNGKVGQLVDYQSNAKVDARLFELPAEYSRVSIDALRNRR